VWVVTCADGSGTDASLVAYPAVPPASGSWRPVASFPLGTVAKFVQPATDGGRVYVGTRDGRVLSFGRPTAAAVQGTTTDFGLVPVGSHTTHDVTLRAADAVRITSVTTAAPFTVEGVTPATPSDLAADDTETVTVGFTPTAATTTADVLTVTAESPGGQPATYHFALTGTGTQDGVSAAPAALAFGDVRIGEPQQLAVTLRNTGTQDATVTGVDGADGPFAASAPPVGFVLPAQQTVTIPVSFAPTVPGPAAETLEITTTTGSVDVPLTGTGEAGAPALTVATQLDFGNVAPGATAEVGLLVANTGTTTLTITKAAPPAAPFQVAQPLAEGQRIAPGDALTVFVDVRPTSARAVTDVYSITGDDGQGARKVVLTANSRPWSGPIPGALGCIGIAGAQQVSGTAAVSYPCYGMLTHTFGFGAVGSLRFPGPTSPWCLDVTRGGTAVGTPVQLWRCNGTAAQTWTWDSSGRFVNPHAQLCLDVLNHSTAKNARLVLASCTTTPSQKWDASGLTAARGYVGSGVASSGVLCLATAAGGTTSGTALATAACGAANQVVTRNGSTLRIANQCVTVAATAATRGTGVRIQPCSGASTQQWQPGTYGKLTNPASKLCLDVPRASTTAGTLLQMWTCNNTVAQSWTLP
jgi:hypothetical protein